MKTKLKTTELFREKIRTLLTEDENINYEDIIYAFLDVCCEELPKRDAWDAIITWHNLNVKFIK